MQTKYHRDLSRLFILAKPSETEHIVERVGKQMMTDGILSVNFFEYGGTNNVSRGLKVGYSSSQILKVFMTLLSTIVDTSFHVLITLSKKK